MSDILGKYYSKWITTGSAVVGQDLISTVETDTGENITAKKLILVSSASLSVDINNSGSYFVLSDYSGSYLLQLDAYDILVSSLKVKESGRACFLSLIY